MDVAALSMRIDSSDVVSATRDLDKFAASSDRAAASGAKLSGSGNTAKLAGDYARAAQAADRAGGAVERATQMVSAANAHVVTYRNHLQGIVSASGQAAAAQGALATSVSRASVATQQADAHVIAHRANLERLATANKTAGATSVAMATQTTAVGVASRATGAIVTGLAGVFGGLVGVLVGSVIAALIDVVAGFFETDKAMKSVELGADSLGDAQGVLGKMFDLTTGKIKSQNEMLILNARLTAINMRAEAVAQKANFDSTVGGFRGGSSGVGLGTKALGFLGFDVSGSYGREQGVAAITQALKAGKITREQALQQTEKLDFSGLNATKQEYQQAIIDGVAAELKVKAADLIDQSLDSGVLADEFRKAERVRKPRKERSGGKTDAQKIADLVRNAQAEITAEQNRAKAVEMSAEAAAELEQKTKLLNAAASAGLRPTDALTKKIDELAAAYADAKIAADVSEATKSLTEDIDKQRAAIADEIKLIGLRGDALARARREMEAQKKLTDSLPRGAIAVTGNLTSGLSDDIEGRDRDARMANVRKDAEDAAYAMDLERNALGLTGSAAIEYAFIAERLNEAKRAGIELSPAEVAAINAAGAAYANQRYEVDKAAQSLDDSREIARGFFSDWSRGVRETGNIFKSFADAAVSSINRIIDKLIEAAIQQMFFNSVAGAGGGGAGGFLGSITSLFGFANGGAFGTAEKFANGGTFTNQIVTSPTLFRFAKGAQLGEMGEDGPEAIMPLGRLPNGKLGVHATGGAGGGSGVRGAPTFSVHQEIKVEGGFMPDAVMAVARQAGEEAVATSRRSFETWAQEWDADGAVV